MKERNDSGVHLAVAAQVISESSHKLVFPSLRASHGSSGESRILAKGMPPKKFIYNSINLFY
jgi:hypothetical protein